MANEIESLPLTKDIKLVRGGDWHETINLFEDDKVTPKNTTGYDCVMTIFKEQNGEEFDSLTITNGKIVHTAASGQFNINLTATQIDAYNFSSAMRKIIITDASSGKVPLIVGRVTVAPY